MHAVKSTCHHELPTRPDEYEGMTESAAESQSMVSGSKLVISEGRERITMSYLESQTWALVSKPFKTSAAGHALIKAVWWRRTDAKAAQIKLNERIMDTLLRPNKAQSTRLIQDQTQNAHGRIESVISESREYCELH